MRSDLAERIGTRTGSTTNSVAQTYLRDGAYVTDPVLKDSSATYTPGVSETRGTATTFLHSGLKNADTQTGIAQTVSATRRYDAFGNVVTSTGIWNGPFGYAGGFGYQEDATGLKLLGHRYYDSSTGRFLTRDPQKDGRNWFIYCANDPARGVDSWGLRTAWIQFAVGFILPIIGGGMSVSIGRDLDNGHWGAKAEGGIGWGAGWGLGPGAGLSYEDSSTINGNKVDTGQALTGSTPVLAGEINIEKDGRVSGGGVSAGFGPDHGPSIGFTYEWRVNAVLDLTETAEWVFNEITKIFPKHPDGWLIH